MKNKELVIAGRKKKGYSIEYRFKTKIYAGLDGETIELTSQGGL